MTLDRDGSFLAKDIPILRDALSGRSDYVTGGGRWRVAELGGYPNVVLEFGTTSEAAPQIGLSLFVSKWWSRIRLYYYLTDPDEDQAIEFVRQ